MALAAPARTGSKGWLRGTHRACPPEETLARIAPLLRPAGISRIGELTRLDSPGVAVMQAVRPASRSLVVTVASGVTPELARVAAAMSSLELWHAERLAFPPLWAALAEVRADIGYNPHTLRQHTPSLLNDGMVLDWVPATVLLTGRSTLVPRSVVEYDLSVRDEWSPPVFVASPDGLAAGNTSPEAVLHGLYELLERDSVARAHLLPDAVRIDLSSVDCRDARRMLDAFAAAGATVVVTDVTGPTGIAAFEVAVSGGGAPAATGAGCHLDRDVALCQALATAARERLARIVGARDDLPLAPPSSPARDGRRAAVSTLPAAIRRYTDVAGTTTASFAGEVAEVAARIPRCGAGPVLFVDLTRPEMGLPVVRVVVPGLLHGAGR
ncbi:MAG TPA: YcaO-like family protein [Candidatus Dormibacteraeota bacterium]|nr:YcaO-like family protein [Candidatus Dormibacteraeota bacterium]